MKPLAVIVVLLSWCAGAGVAVRAEVASTAVSPEVKRINPTQSMYLERCGGCHGIQGISAPRLVPSLRAQAGYFLCTAGGRDYLIQLPSVALAPLSDQQLANLMNFVAFDLGAGRSLTPSANLYTAAEVEALRKNPLREIGLLGYRARVVEDVIRQCGAPATLRAYGGHTPP